MNMAVSDAVSPQTREALSRLRDQLAFVIRGTADSIELLLVALLAGGSVLMEDVPGVGKTTLAKALAKSLALDFRRVQFTPDLLPADILGSSIYNPTDGTFHFRRGPIFCNILLADEINRASPRTQSALLESMGEGQATIEGERSPLPVPFMVLATQNPIDFQGTYPLPEAQMDRFLIHLRLGYPAPATEVDILFAQATERPLDHIQPIFSREQLQQVQADVCAVKVERTVAEYLIEIVQRTRSHAQLKLGVSPRGSLMLFRAAQAAAYLAGRTYVLPDDVQRLAVPVLAHRTVLSTQARFSHAAAPLTKNQIIAEIVRQVRVPQ